MVGAKTSCVFLVLSFFSARADEEASTCSSVAGGCQLNHGSTPTLGDDMSLLQLQVEKDAQMGTTEAEGSDSPECVAITLAMSTYGTYGVNPPSGFVTANKYEKVDPGKDVDRVVWFTKGQKCWIVFMGSNSQEDTVSNSDFTPVDKFGLKGVHSGIAFELQPLLDKLKLDFGKMRSSCTELTVAGHSLGGALAQVLAMSINKQGDPLGAQLTVNHLYTFGAMAVTHTKQGDDTTSDGCFHGALFWYAAKGSVHTFAVDVVALHGIGGQNVHRPTKALKYLVSATAQRTPFACGTPLPQADALAESMSFAQWITIHVNYRKWVGCTHDTINPFSSGIFR